MAENGGKLSFRESMAGKYAGAVSILKEAYHDGPLGFWVAALILSGVVVWAVLLGMAGETSDLLNALLHGLPAFILVLGNLRHGAPYPWPRWLVMLGLGVAATVLLRTPLGLGVKTGMDDFVASLSDASLVFAVLILILTLLLPLVVGIATGLHRLPWLGRYLQTWLSPGLIYLPVVLGGIIYAHIALGIKNSSDALFFGSFGTIAMGMAIVFRNGLFPPAEEFLLWRLLPHLPAWLFASLGLISLKKAIGFDEANFGIPALSGSMVLAVLLPPVLAARRLRRDPVPLAPATESSRLDSIQSKIAQYVDVHGQSARLVKAVGRSDAGVFGVTGVRGAGKSALTRHVLHELKNACFTLEVTAPVRHDPGLGFFVSVCKAVCGKTLEDIEPIVTGTRTSTGEKLWDKLRRSLLVLLAGFMVFALIQIVTTSPSATTVSQDPGEAFFRDPLLGGTDVWQEEWWVVQTERAITDRLLAQIKQILEDENSGHGTGGAKPAYLLVPKPESAGFWLLPSVGDATISDRLRAYRASIAKKDSGDFLAFHKSTAGALLRSLLSSHFDTYDKLSWNHALGLFHENPFVTVPLAYLQPLLKQYFTPLTKPAETQAKPSKNSGPPENTTPNPDKPQPKLLSQILFEAFNAEDPDPKLEFNSEKLHQFNDMLRIYQRFLNGKLEAKPDGTPAVGSVAATGIAAHWQRLSDGSIAAQFFWSSAGCFLFVLLVSPAWRATSGLAHAIVNRRYLDLYAEATDFLEQLSYQSNQESNTGLSLQGINFGRKRTLAARDLTLPGLTSRYTRFLAKLRTAYNGKVVIAIDELDKIHDPEQVKALLVEIKGALFVEGTYYLISISEDAARAFRRRLASGRDIFESTFDDVVEIRQMRVEAALAMLGKLEEGLKAEERLPGECLEVAALFGGGIPREIIRSRRVLSHALDRQVGATSAWAVHTLLREELEHWTAHLGEANLSGADTIRLRQYALAASASLEAGAGAAERLGGVWEALWFCVGIIDPLERRKSVGYVAEGQAVPDAEAEAALAGWRQIQSDLQGVLRLLILTHLGERIIRPGAKRQDYESDILACHRALADKPALAETLLLEMRTALYPSAAAEAAFPPTA